MKTKLLKCCVISFLFHIMFYGLIHAQSGSIDFTSAVEAITWAKANKVAAADIKHITITGNNDAADLLKLRTLNNNSGNGYFKSLESIELSAQTGNIPNACFYEHYHGAQWLKRFSASNLTGIGSWAFRFCTNLLEVDLPALTNIGAYAFYNCNFTTIHLPISLVSIDANPFLGCKNLTNIIVSEGNEYFTVENGILYNVDKTLLIAYPSGKTETTYNAPNTVASIGCNSFGICTNLSSMELLTVVNVNDWASEYCSGLKTIKFKTSEIVNLGSNVFSGVTTANIDLYLNEKGAEYKNNVNGNVWKDNTWKSINAEKYSSISEIEKIKVSVFPNPVKNILHIESNEEIKQISIYDMNAKIVLQTNNAGNNLDLNTLSSGLYVVRIATFSCIKTERVLKID